MNTLRYGTLKRSNHFHIGNICVSFNSKVRAYLMCVVGACINTTLLKIVDERA